MAVHRLSFAAVAVAAAGVALTGCGGASSDMVATAAKAGAASSAQVTTVGETVLALRAPADGALRFSPTDLRAKVGRVTIRMANLARVDHSIAIEGNGVSVSSPQRLVGRDETATVSVVLKRGTYTYFCPVDSHRQAGMSGTLVVT